MVIDHVHKYELPLLGAYQIPLRKRIRCSARESFEKILLCLNRQTNEKGQAEDASFEYKFDPTKQHLSIMNSPQTQQ